jgi:hypothetical protein
MQRMKAVRARALEAVDLHGRWFVANIVAGGAAVASWIALAL